MAGVRPAVALKTGALSEPRRVCARMVAQHRSATAAGERKLHACWACVHMYIENCAGLAAGYRGTHGHSLGGRGGGGHAHSLGPGVTSGTRVGGWR